GAGAEPLDAPLGRLRDHALGDVSFGAALDRPEPRRDGRRARAGTAAGDDHSLCAPGGRDLTAGEGGAAVKRSRAEAMTSSVATSATKEAGWPQLPCKVFRPQTGQSSRQ